ncbi:MAG: hypothetical protein LIO65_08310, partial [Odoribacter sp.]|nr:hypothetical protein [Odoribacter sp.]
NYVYIKDNTLTTSVNFNTLFINPNSSEQVFVPFTEITNGGAAWNNGKAYSYGGNEIFEPNSTSIQGSLASIRDYTYPYYMFSSLLRSANLADLSTETLFISERCIIFIPTNDVIINAINANEIPGVSADSGEEDGYIVTDQNSLALYLSNYFLPTTGNTNTYPYIGSGMAGPYNSAGLYQVYITDNGQQLSIQLYQNGSFLRNRVNVVPDFNYFPFAFNDAGIHFIDSVL